MEEENHLDPLAKNYHKSDEEFVTIKPFAPPSSHQERSSKCLVYVLLAVVLQSIAFLIFGLVVLRITTPTLRLSNVVVKDLLNESTSLNMTMITEIRLQNKNFGRFKFHGGSTTLLYENVAIGATNIYNGRVGSREKTKINATVNVIITNSSHELFGNHMNFSRDIGFGLVKLRNLAELRGEVRVMKIINRHRTAVMNCSMNLNLTSHLIQGLSCQ